MRLFDGAMTLWTQTAVLTTSVPVPKRKASGPAVGGIKARRPDIQWAQARHAVQLQSLKNMARLSMLKLSVRTPWSDDMYHVPSTMVAKVGEKMQQLSARLKKIQADMLGSLAQDTLTNRATLRDLADSEYKACDPFGFTDKKAWVAEYLADLEVLIPSATTIRSQYIRAVAAKVEPLEALTPPGVHTMGAEAIRALAEDVAWSRLLPVLECMSRLRDWSQRDRDKAVAFPTDINQLRRHVDDLEAWGQYPGDPVVQAARGALGYIESTWSIIFKDVAQPQRDDLAALLLPGARLLVDKKGLNDRVEYLLGGG